MRQHRNVGGFPLIELLVVITILAILAAIPFPVFAQAREEVRQASCLSNTKQRGTAMYLYARNYDATFVPYHMASLNPYSAHADVDTSTKPMTFFSPRLNPNIKNDPVWKCPSTPCGWVHGDPTGAGQDLAFRSYGGQNSTYRVDPTSRSCPRRWKNIGNSCLFSTSTGEPSGPQAQAPGTARYVDQILVTFLEGHSWSPQYNRLISDPGLVVVGTTSICDPYKSGCQ